MDPSVLRLLTVALVFVNLHFALTRVPSNNPGSCPKKPPKICSLSRCKSNIDCEADFKCCFYRGRGVCVKPVVNKLGSCPRPRPDQRSLCVKMCSSDGDCEGNLKCCSNGCGRQCMGVDLPPKPGYCPRLSGEGCIDECSSDYDCDRNQKCCSHRCGHQCVELFPPLPVNKPGSCPRLLPGQIGICVERCSSDGDCKGNLKCCSNGCGHQCSEVEPPPKPGSCPRLSGEGCIDECSSDRHCGGNHKCCPHRCGHQCVEPFPPLPDESK